MKNRPKLLTVQYYVESHNMYPYSNLELQYFLKKGNNLCLKNQQFSFYPMSLQAKGYSEDFFLLSHLPCLTKEI